MQTNNEQNRAKEQAESQVQSIVAMVAALNVDYDRLEELRELAKIPRYVAGWNMPGYMPDSEPTEFDDEDDARAYIADEMESAAYAELEDGEHTNEREQALLEAAARVRAGFGEYGETVGKYHYFITEDGFIPLDEDDAAELAELEKDADGCESEDAARERIQNDALDVQVRSDWHSVGDEDGSKPSEFSILLCTGGPAVRIRGELNNYSEPCRAWVEYQDWFTPWTELVSPCEQSTLLAYCQQFYFGE